MIKFSSEPPNGFYQTLTKRADAYFNVHHRPKSGHPILYLKALILLLLYVGTYITLFQSGKHMVFAYMFMGFLTVPIILNIGHEAVHNTFSPYPRLNALLSHVFNLSGTGNRIWRFKHVKAHHVFPNIAGHDFDIAQNSLARIAPSAPYYKAHRFQHLYMPFMYLIYTLNWLIYRDFNDFRLHFADKPNSGLHLLGLIGSKLFYLAYMLFLPIFLLPQESGSVLLGFFLMQFTMSATTFLVLVSAHVGEDAVFPLPDGQGKMGHSWSEHQLLTTTDFATESHFVTHLFGGFNHHVVHHLFPNVSHVHYPKLTEIVRETAHEFGLIYRCFPDIKSSVVSHFYFLKKNGLRPDFFDAADL